MNRQLALRMAKANKARKEAKRHERVEAKVWVAGEFQKMHLDKSLFEQRFPGVSMNSIKGMESTSSNGWRPPPPPLTSA